MHAYLHNKQAQTNIHMYTYMCATTVDTYTHTHIYTST